MGKALPPVEFGVAVKDGMGIGIGMLSALGCERTEPMLGVGRSLGSRLF